MSTLAEIEQAIAMLPPEQWAEIRRWINSSAPRPAGISRSGKVPDFLARQRTIFGDRVLPDSQAALDEIRGDRF